MISLTPAQAQNILDNLTAVAPYFGYADGRAVLTRMVEDDVAVGARLETMLVYLANGTDDSVTLSDSLFPPIPYQTPKLAGAGVQGIVHTTLKMAYYRIGAARFVRQMGIALRVKYDSARSMLSKPEQLGYAEYIQSPQWEPNRVKAIKRAGNRCQKCGRGKCRLEVHHISYVRMGQERPEDLMALCPDCHKVMDQRSGYGKGRKEARRG